MHANVSRAMAPSLDGVSLFLLQAESETNNYG